MMRAMKTLKLKINGMHCGSCAKIIALDLEQVTGVKKVEVDQKTNSATVVIDEGIIGDQMILETIKNSGYEGELR